MHMTTFERNGCLGYYTVTWSQVGKLNIQANKVFCMQWGIVTIDKGCPFHQFSKNQLLEMLQLASVWLRHSTDFKVILRLHRAL